MAGLIVLKLITAAVGEDLISLVSFRVLKFQFKSLKVSFIKSCVLQVQKSERLILIES